MLGASPGELSFVALLVVIVLLAQIAPRVGDFIGARYEKAGRDGEPGRGSSNPSGKV